MLKLLIEGTLNKETNEDEIALCRVHIGHTCGARCRYVVRAFPHGAMGRRIDPSWGGPIKLFFVPTSAPRLV